MLVARDRTGGTVDFVTGRGAVTKQQLHRHLPSRYLPNYLGWRWALDGDRIANAERLLRAAIGAFHT